MSDPPPGGYDAATALRQDDDLDRWRFAKEIVEVALATPPDWSARIGIFGKWGEGKSTVLRFAESIFKAKSSVVFSFNPWAVQNWNELWEQFGNRLSEALTSAQIRFDGSWKKSVKNSTRWLEAKGASQIASMTATFLGREKLVNSAFGALNQWLRYDGAQIREIRAKIKDKRLIVLIDDLDRCNPKLIPQLLLSLRELLDLPGFTFILAFDEDIVSSALAQENPSWSSGTDFLEKILDFRFHIPPITDPQKERLIAKALTKYCPFVPQKSATEVRDLLPDNPRKLKALIRSLAALKSQIDRHDPDELNWVDMWLAQLLRLESYAYFDRLITGGTLEEQVGTIYELRRARSRDELGSKGEDEDNSLRNAIKDAGVEDSAVVERLIQLIVAMRSRASLKLRYVCEIALRPHAVTWKEFRSFYAGWTADRRATTISDWIENHANTRGASTRDVETELFEAAVMRRNECLASAAESASIPEHDSFIDQAKALLTLIEQDLLDLAKLESSRFKKVHDQIFHWIAFRRNPGDKALRGLEEALLLKLLSSATDALATELFEIITPKAFHPEVLAEAAPERRALTSNCMAILGPKVAREAITFMTRAGGIQSLSERGRFPAVKYCLFNHGSAIWSSNLRNQFLELIRGGREDFTIYVNVRDFFNLLVQGLEWGVDSIGREEIAALLRDEALVQSMWETITARGIQYRLQITFIRARQSLIQNGISEAALPLTDDLRSRLSEEELREGPQTRRNEGRIQAQIPDGPAPQVPGPDQ